MSFVLCGVALCCVWLIDAFGLVWFCSVVCVVFVFVCVVVLVRCVVCVLFDLGCVVCLWCVVLWCVVLWWVVFVLF